MGADVAINYHDEDFLDVIKSKATGKKVATGVPVIGNTQDWGVDVILDLVGARHFEKNIAALNLEGRLLLVGTPSGGDSKISLPQVAFSLATPAQLGCLLPPFL